MLGGGIVGGAAGTAAGEVVGMGSGLIAAGGDIVGGGIDTVSSVANAIGGLFGNGSAGTDVTNNKPMPPAGNQFMNDPTLANNGAFSMPTGGQGKAMSGGLFPTGPLPDLGSSGLR